MFWFQLVRMQGFTSLGWYILTKLYEILGQNFDDYPGFQPKATAA